MGGAHEDQETSPGVSSLLNQFEALARHDDTAAKAAKRPTASLVLPPASRASSVPGSRARALSSPHSPSSLQRTGFLDGPGVADARTVRPSPSQPNLFSAADASRDASAPPAGQSETISGGDQPGQRQRPLSPLDAANRTSADVAGSPADASFVKRKAPPPPVPVRKKAATVPAPMHDSAVPLRPPVPPRARSPSPSASRTESASLLAPPKRTASPLPLADAQAVSRPSEDVSPPLSNLSSPRAYPTSSRSRSPSPFRADEHALSATGQLDSRLSATSILPTTAPSAPIDIPTKGPGAPDLPPRKNTSASPSPATSPVPPPVPPRLGEVLHHHGPRIGEILHHMGRPRRSSEAALVPHLTEDLTRITHSASDQSAVPALLPPPVRSIGLNERRAPVRPFVSSNWNSDSSDEEAESQAEKKAIDDLPDATFASRRAPELEPPRGFHSKSPINAIAVQGHRVVCCGLHHVRVYDCFSGTQTMSFSLPGEPKTTAVVFRSAQGGVDDGRHEVGRFLIVGCKDGSIFAFDLMDGSLTNSRTNAHSAHIIGMFRRGESWVSLDETGKVLVWQAEKVHRAPLLGSTIPKVHRIDRCTFAKLIEDKLWTASSVPRQGAAVVGGSNRQALIRVYDVFKEDPSSFNLLPRAVSPKDDVGVVGAVTDAARVQSTPGYVYLGHETGHVSVWSSETYTCIDVLRISSFAITALCGVGPLLWAGYRTGSIYVYDVMPRPWKVVKAWKAHKDAVAQIFVDSSSLWLTSSLHVISIGIEQSVHFWDGFLRTDWLALHLFKREADFCSYDSLRVLMCTWNLDAAKPVDLSADGSGTDVLAQMLGSMESPDVIVFGFQETIDLGDKKLTAKSILFGRKRADSLLSENISSQYKLWYEKLIQAVRLAMPADCPYTVTHTENLVGLFTCVFVKNAQRQRLRDVDIATVKTGMGGRYGNKGAIVSRFVIDDTSLCFVNCHLAAGQRHLRQRNKDLIEILEAKAPFADVKATAGDNAWIAGGDGSMCFDHRLLFLSGDLNYRIDLRRDVVISHVGKQKLEALVSQDQLLKEMRSNPAFRLKSFTEAGPLAFAPTYKYDRGSDDYDTSEKARVPAWCDRILYRIFDAGAITTLHYSRHEVHISDHRPVSAGFVARIRRVDPSKKTAVEQEIALKWSEHEALLIEKAKAFHFTEV